MLVRITNPTNEHYYYENQLTDVVRQGDIVLPVLEDQDPTTEGYLIIGEVGNRQTELRKVSSYLNNRITLVAELKQNHTQATNIYFTYYKNVAIYRTVDGDKNLLTTVPIDYNKTSTVYNDPEYETLASDGKEVEYTSSFVNASNNKETNPLPAYTGDSTGYTLYDKRVTAKEMIRELNEVVYANPNATEKTDSAWLLDINNGLNEIITSEIQIHENEYFFQQADYQLVAGKANYKLPERHTGNLDVRIDGCTIQRRSLTRTEQTCCPICKEEQPEPVVDPCNKCETHIEEEECWRPQCEICNHIYYWQITGSEIIISPTPKKDGTLSLSYYGMPEPFSLASKGTFLPEGFREAVKAAALFQHYLYRKKDAEGQAYAGNLKGRLNELKQNIREIILKRAVDARTPTQQRVVKGERVENAMAGYFTQFGGLRVENII